MSKRQPTPCALWADQLVQASLGHLSDEEHSSLRGHLAVCPACAAAQTAYLQTAALLRQTPGPDPLTGLPPQLLQAWAAEEQRPVALRQPHARHLREVSMRTIHEQTSSAHAPTPPGDRHRRGHHFIGALSAVAAVLVVVIIITGIVVSRGALPRSTNSAHPGSSTASSPTTPAAMPYVPSANDALEAVQMFSSSEGWAVGGAYTQVQGGGVFSALALHYVNGQWVRVATPTDAQLGVHDVELLSIAMVSPDEGWAVGFATNPGNGSVRSLPMGIILHFMKGGWIESSVTPNAEYYQVRMLSPTDGWIAGGGGWDTDQGATRSILLHYTGSQWTSAQVPNMAGITSLDMLSATDGWATGTDTILHYNGQQWSIFQHLQGISGVSMDSATDGWAFGEVLFPTQPSNSYNEVWHFNGSQWARGTLPDTVNADVAIEALSMDSASDGWAVGFGNGNKGESRYALYLHYTNGQWTQVQGPGNVNLNGVFMLSANEGWAVGFGELMHYQNGAWTQYQG